jgi:hypothetical protein
MSRDIDVATRRVRRYRDRHKLAESRCARGSELAVRSIMQRLAFLIFLVGCAEHGSGGGPADMPPLPEACVGRCISDIPVTSFEQCCDSVTCWFDEAEDKWQVTFCDAPVDPCAACGPNELCVQRLDGTCGMSTVCEPRVVECPENACTPECEQAYCGSPFQCQNRIPCGQESQLAFTCYGP